MLALHADKPAPREDRLVRADDVVWRTIPGVAVLLLRGMDQELLILSGTGLTLWEELAVPRHLDEVTLSFSQRFGVPPDVVADDLTAVLAELHARGVVCHER